MPSILNMAQQLLSMGRTYLENHQTAEGLRLLRRLVHMPTATPAMCAEANYLIAQVSMNRSEYSEAKEALREALQKDPQHAQCHFLFAQSNDQDGDGSEEESLEHYETASALAPQDGRLASAYALKVSKAKDRDKGLDMLRDCYHQHGSNPVVVEDFVEGLLQADRHQQAELVVTQAVYRNPGDDRFKRLRQRFDQRMREERLFGSYPTGEVAGDGDILKFENFEMDRPSKPRGPKRPAAKPEAELEPVEQPTEKQEASVTKIPVYGDQMVLGEVLKRAGRDFVHQLYGHLGLMGKVRPDLQRKEIQAVLLQRTFLRSMIKRYESPTRKLLKTVVQLGGFVPANVLFQTTGSDAPPPDFCQPLLQNGLLYLGKEQGDRRRKNPAMIAMIPVDLVERLADVLKVNLDEA